MQHKTNSQELLPPSDRFPVPSSAPFPTAPAIVAPPNPGGTALAEMERYADIALQSGLFPSIQSKAAAVVQISYGAELGISAFAALRSIHIIPPSGKAANQGAAGKVELSANLMLALMQRAGFQWEFLQNDEAACIIRWWYPGGRYAGESEFNSEDAHKTGRSGWDNWKKYKKDMLMARAVSRGARKFAPAILHGCYVEGEISDRQEVNPAPVHTPQQPQSQPQQPEPRPQVENVSPEEAEKRRKANLARYHATVKSAFVHLVPDLLKGSVDWHQVAKTCYGSKGSLSDLPYLELEQLCKDVEDGCTDAGGRLYQHADITHDSIAELQGATDLEGLAEIWGYWRGRLLELPMVIRGSLFIAKEWKKAQLKEQKEASKAEPTPAPQSTPEPSPEPTPEPSNADSSAGEQ